MGKPMREAIGGGKAIIPSNVKVAAAGTAIDVPLADRDDVWLFDHIDTITVAVPDAPRPAEIVVVVALSDGGRPRPRIDKDGARPSGGDRSAASSGSRPYGAPLPLQRVRQGSAAIRSISIRLSLISRPVVLQHRARRRHREKLPPDFVEAVEVRADR